VVRTAGQIQPPYEYEILLTNHSYWKIDDKDLQITGIMLPLSEKQSKGMQKAETELLKGGG
jgi:hypothetical protein